MDAWDEIGIIIGNVQSRRPSQMIAAASPQVQPNARSAQSQNSNRSPTVAPSTRQRSGANDNAPDDFNSLRSVCSNMQDDMNIGDSLFAPPYSYPQPLDDLNSLLENNIHPCDLGFEPIEDPVTVSSNVGPGQRRDQLAESKNLRYLDELLTLVDRNTQEKISSSRTERAVLEGNWWNPNKQVTNHSNVVEVKEVNSNKLDLLATGGLQQKENASRFFVVSSSGNRVGEIQFVDQDIDERKKKRQRTMCPGHTGNQGVNPHANLPQVVNAEEILKEEATVSSTVTGFPAENVTTSEDTADPYYPLPPLEVILMSPNSRFMHLVQTMHREFPQQLQMFMRSCAGTRGFSYSETDGQNISVKSMLEMKRILQEMTPSDCQPIQHLITGEDKSLSRAERILKEILRISADGDLSHWEAQISVSERSIPAEGLVRNSSILAPQVSNSCGLSRNRGTLVVSLTAPVASDDTQGDRQRDTGSPLFDEEEDDSEGETDGSDIEPDQEVLPGTFSFVQGPDLLKSNRDVAHPHEKTPVSDSVCETQFGKVKFSVYSGIRWGRDPVRKKERLRKKLEEASDGNPCPFICDDLLDQLGNEDTVEAVREILLEHNKSCPKAAEQKKMDTTMVERRGEDSNSWTSRPSTSHLVIRKLSTHEVSGISGRQPDVPNAHPGDEPRQSSDFTYSVQKPVPSRLESSRASQIAKNLLRFQARDLCRSRMLEASKNQTTALPATSPPVAPKLRQPVSATVRRVIEAAPAQQDVICLEDLPAKRRQCVDENNNIVVSSPPTQPTNQQQVRLLNKKPLPTTFLQTACPLSKLTSSIPVSSKAVSCTETRPLLPKPPVTASAAPTAVASDQTSGFFPHSIFGTGEETSLVRVNRGCDKLLGTCPSSGRKTGTMLQAVHDRHSFSSAGRTDPPMEQLVLIQPEGSENVEVDVVGNGDAPPPVPTSGTLSEVRREVKEPPSPKSLQARDKILRAMVSMPDDVDETSQHYHRPRHYEFVALSVGDFYTEVPKHAPARFKIIYSSRKIIYEFEFPLTSPGSDGPQILHIELKFSSIIALQSSQSTLVVTVSQVPLVLVGRRVTAGGGREGQTPVWRPPSPTDQPQLLQFVNGDLADSPMHHVRFSGPTCETVCRYLGRVSARFQGMLAARLDLDGYVPRWCLLPSSSTEQANTEGVGKRSRPTERPKWIGSDEPKPCHCALSCRSLTCPCSRSSLPCGKDVAGHCCSCGETCGNTFNVLKDQLVDIQAAREDTCLVQNVFAATAPWEVSRQLASTRPCPHCHRPVRVRDVIPMQRACPFCRRPVVFSWCLSTLKDRRNHCLVCIACSDINFQHCLVCKFCTRRELPGGACMQCNLRRNNRTNTASLFVTPESRRCSQQIFSEVERSLRQQNLPGFVGGRKEGERAAEETTLGGERVEEEETNWFQGGLLENVLGDVEVRFAGGD